MSFPTLRGVLLVDPLMKDKEGFLNFSPTDQMIQKLGKICKRDENDEDHEKEDVADEDDEEENSSNGDVVIHDNFEFIKKCHVEDRLYASWRFKKGDYS